MSPPSELSPSPSASPTTVPAPPAVSPGHAVVAPADAMPTLLPRQLSAHYSAADLPGQFVLSRTDEAVPSGWRAHRQQGWTLGVHPSLPVTTMRARDGSDVGWLVGYPINETAQFIHEIVALPFDHHAPASDMEAWLSRLCGRFLTIWLTSIYARVYPDSGALFSAVFAREHDQVASTTSLIPYSRGCDDDVDLVQRARKNGARTVLGFGLTPRRGVERLQPNHYLDLNTWTTARHWPVQPLDEACDLDETIDTVSRSIQRHVAAGVRKGKLFMALTAGLDSRTVLASSREYAGQFELMTLAIPDRSGRIDVDVAARIAARHGLSHRVVPQPAPALDAREAWLWRTGWCVSEPRGWRAHLGEGAEPVVEVTGAGGEAARVAFWRLAGSGKLPLTPEVLVDCLHLPRTEVTVRRAAAWMESYPASTPARLLDGFYLENSLGVTAGALSYGDAPYVSCRLHPFVNRAALQAVMRLPDWYRIEGRFPLDLIRQNWPELLRTPFNRRSGLRHYFDRARRHGWFMRHAVASAGR